MIRSGPRQSATGKAARVLAFGFLLACGSLAFAFTTTTPRTPSSSFNYPLRVQQTRKAPSLSIPVLPRVRSQRSDSFGPLSAASSDETEDKLFDAKTTIALVGGQSLLIGAAAIAAKFTGTPNFGLGPGIDFGVEAIGKGILWSLPLGVLAVVLDFVEDKFPALQDVTKATQSSVLTLLGGTFKPVVGVLTALGLGLAAGIGEEMLFRGVLQFELASRTGEMLAVGISSLIFGALHAVTPLYAFLATLASFYFGWLYLVTGNLAIPIATHAFYDWAALLYAHWTVANLSEDAQKSLLEWQMGSGETVN